MSDSLFSNIKACVFDAYGTLFDVHSAVGQYRSQVGEQADSVSALWRTKQLEYTWLRSLMGAYEPFWQVTSEALDYALASHALASNALHESLMNAYLHLDAYPEVTAMLQTLNDSGIACAILTNGSPDMIEAAVGNAGIAHLLEAQLSVDAVGIFKPDPRVYQLAVDALKVEPHEISFQSSNAWDAAGAAYFGFQVAWINRFGQEPERLPGKPQAELKDLTGLPQLVGAQ